MPATATKRQLVEHAFNECALNGWELDISPEEKAMALTRLDALMNELAGRGMNLNYNFPSTLGGGTLSDTLGCDDQAFYGLATLLADRLSPTMGKTQGVAARRAVTEAMKAVRAMAAELVPTVQFPTGTPWGSGNKPWALRVPFVDPPTTSDPTIIDGGTP